MNVAKSLLSTLLIYAVLCIPLFAFAEFPQYCLEQSSVSVVKIDLQSPLTQTLPGLSMPILVSLKNPSHTPVVNAQVWVHVYRNNDSMESIHSNFEKHLVDYFIVEDSVSLLSNESKDILTEWNVPNNAFGGTYEAVVSFSVNHKQQTSQIKNSLPFRVTSSESHIFVEPQYKINNQSYTISDNHPHFSRNTPVEVTVALKNPTTYEHSVDLTWITSGWSTYSSKGEIDRGSTGIVVAPGETKYVSYIPPITHTSLVDVEAIVQDGEAMSVLNFKFIRDGYENAQLLTTTLSMYPISVGMEIPLSTCVEVDPSAQVGDFSVLTTVTDITGEIVYSNANSITGVGQSSFIFSLTKHLQSFTITSALLKNGKEVEKITQSYICENFVSLACSEQTSQSEIQNSAQKPPHWYFVFVAIGIIFTYSVLRFMYSRNIKMHIPEQ